MGKSAFSIQDLDWRAKRGEAALAEVNRTITLPKGTWRRFAAFLGPGYLVAVGYMDPGNWATSIAGGGDLWLYIAGGGADVKSDGDFAAILVRASGDWIGARSGPSLP